MNFFDANKSIIENIYLLSGPILAILGFFIFKQIKFAKRNLELAEKQVNEAKKYLKTISEREAAVLSANQVQSYLEKILPLIDKVSDKKKEIEFPKFTGEIKNFNGSEFKEWDSKFSNEFLTKLSSLEYLDLELINKLEGFAIFFTHGIANEEIAFSSSGVDFCETVENNYCLISILREDNTPNKQFKNLVELYWLWKNRINLYHLESQLENKQAELKKELSNLDEIKKGVPQNKKIKPIGTED